MQIIEEMSLVYFFEIFFSLVEREHVFIRSENNNRKKGQENFEINLLGKIHNLHKIALRILTFFIFIHLCL